MIDRGPRHRKAAGTQHESLADGAGLAEDSHLSLPQQIVNRLPLFAGIALAWVLWGGINVFRLGAVPGLDGNQAFWYGFPDAVIWAALTPLVVTFARRYPVRREHRLRTLGWHLVAAVGFVLLHAAADAGLAGLLALLAGTEPFWRLVFWKVLRYGFQMNMLVYALVAGLVLYIDYERRLARGEQQAAALKAQLVAARLAGLERQLRPHFLFNALNTVSGLMGADAATGRRVVRRLGELLRAGLEGPPGQRIPLRRELDLARAYLDIEQIRFEDRLRVTIEVEPSRAERREETLAFPVPALILQPLVENAVTHGVAKLEDGGSIRILAELENEELILKVEDDGPGLAASAQEPGGFGVGLASTRERLEALYGERAEGYLHLEPVNPRGARVRLSLPLRQGVPQ